MGRGRVFPLWIWHYYGQSVAKKEDLCVCVCICKMFNGCCCFLLFLLLHVTAVVLGHLCGCVRETEREGVKSYHSSSLESVNGFFAPQSSKAARWHGWWWSLIMRCWWSLCWRWERSQQQVLLLMMVLIMIMVKTWNAHQHGIAGSKGQANGWWHFGRRCHDGRVGRGKWRLDALILFLGHEWQAACRGGRCRLASSSIVICLFRVESTTARRHHVGQVTGRRSKG